MITYALSDSTKDLYFDYSSTCCYIGKVAYPSSTTSVDTLTCDVTDLPCFDQAEMRSSVSHTQVPTLCREEGVTGGRPGSALKPPEK